MHDWAILTVLKACDEVEKMFGDVFTVRKVGTPLFFLQKFWKCRRNVVFFESSATVRFRNLSKQSNRIHQLTPEFVFGGL